MLIQTYRATMGFTAAAMLLMFADPISSFAGTTLEYSGVPFTVGGVGQITATITLRDVIEPNTIYEQEDGDFLSGSITDSDRFWAGTYALVNSIIETDAAGNVEYWDVRGNAPSEDGPQNVGSYNCLISIAEYCQAGDVGDGDPSGISIAKGTWLCSDQCLAGSDTVPGASIAPEPSTYGLALLGAGSFWMLSKRRRLKFRTPAVINLASR